MLECLVVGEILPNHGELYEEEEEGVLERTVHDADALEDAPGAEAAAEHGGSSFDFFVDGHRRDVSSCAVVRSGRQVEI